MKQTALKILIFVAAIISSSTVLNAQTYPPSCVITAPHSNSYFKENTDVVIRVYSTDVGKTANNGTVTKVEFYDGTTKLGETSTHVNNTYEFTLGCISTGEHLITAVATNSKGVSFTSAGVYVNVGTEEVETPGMSSCKGKYLANIIAGSVNNDYQTYWNGVTAENGCKWESVEGTRDQMNWSQADISYNYAANNNLMFRYHAIAWGSQYPKWIEALSTNVTEFRAEVEEYMAAVAARYKYMDQIDVLNENLYLNTYNGQEHQTGTPFFRAGLGGPGTTGYDWVIWLFTKARQYFPNSKLVMNDFELVNNTAGINEMLDVIKALRDRGLIDGFGTQSHCFNVDALQNSPNTLKSNLTQMANSGLPVFVTELDLNGGSTVSEQEQYDSYSNLFPVYWEHPAVAGITLWGYVEGSTWKTGTGILNSNRTERSSMVWLKNYIAGRNDVGYPFCTQTGCTNPTNPSVSITSPLATDVLTEPASFTIEATASDPDGNVTLVEFYIDDKKVGEDASSTYSVDVNSITAGTHIIKAVVTDNDGNTGSSQRSITVKGQEVTGEIVINAKGVVGDETIELEIDGEIVDTWTLSTSFADYTATGNVNGLIRINYTNDDGADRDVEIDYITVVNIKYEAEDQAINTGYYANGSCGGGGNSQLMHCNGYIEFVTNPVQGHQAINTGYYANGSCGGGGNSQLMHCNGYIEFVTNPVQGPTPVIGVSLKKGWNLIGYPKDGSAPVETALSQILQYVEVIKDMDSFYVSGNPSGLNSLTELKWGCGYYIKVNADCKIEW